MTNVHTIFIWRLPMANGSLSYYRTNITTLHTASAMPAALCVFHVRPLLPTIIHCSILLLASHFYSSLMINITYENEKLLTFNIIYIIHLQQWILLEILLNSLRYCECLPGIMGHNFFVASTALERHCPLFFVQKNGELNFTYIYINAGD